MTDGGDRGEFGPEWEAWADAVLAESDFDTDLGKAMARDAQRVANGELDAETFQERHREAVLEAFGVDERVLGPADESVADPAGPTAEGGPDGRPEGGRDPLPGIPSFDGDASRRKVLGAVGAMVAGSAVANAVSSSVRASAQDPVGGTETGAGDGSGSQMGMVIDTERCIACLKCSLACKQENDTDVGMHWVYVFRYEEDRLGEPDVEPLTRPCQHCSSPSCAYVCPTQARHKRWDEDGLVLTDYDLCVGCKYCMVACPYGVNYLGEGEPTGLSPGFQYDTHGRFGKWVAGPPPEEVMGKCTFCVHRQDSGDPALEGTTACEDICPADAIHFGDLTDPESDPRQHLRTKPRSNIFRLLDEVGNDPNVIYIGKEPSKDAEPVQGEITYEDRDMVILGDFGFDDGDGDH